MYVALTNECNSVTLIASRGPSFKMPVSSGFVPLDNGKEPGAQHVFDVGGYLSPLPIHVTKK